MRPGSKPSSRSAAAGAAASARNISTVASRRSATRSRCRRTGPASSACSRCRPTRKGSSAPKRGARYERQTVSADADADHRQSGPETQLRRFLGLDRRQLRAARPPGRPQRSRTAERAPERRGAVRQRPASRHPVVRDRRSRLRQGEKQRPRADPAGDRATATASAPRPIHIWFDDYIFEAADRRGRGRSAGLPVSARPMPAISASRWRARSALGKVGGVTHQSRRARRLCPRDDRDGRPGAAHPAAAAARRDRGAVGRGQRPHRGRACHRPGPARRARDAGPAASPWSTPRSRSSRCGDHKELSITLSANNIFDVDARRHASFLKDYAPLAGRDLRLTARLSF